MKKFCVFALALALFPVAGCKKPAQPKEEAVAEPVASPTPTPTPEDPLATKIGFFVPLKGAQTTFGQDAQRGAQLAVDEINSAGGVLGHPLKLVTKDTKSDPATTTSVVTELIEKDGVAALIGEIATDRSLIAAPIAQQHGIPMISPASTNEQVTAAGDSIFRVCYVDPFQAEVMSKFCLSIGVTKAAILFDSTSSYSTGLAESFKNAFTTNGGQIAGEERYTTGDRDFSVQLNAIKALNPEVVFLPSYYAEAALIIRQARQLGLDMPFVGTDGWDSPDFLQTGGAAVNNCYFASHFSPWSGDPAIAPFVQAYTTKYNAPPPPLAALSYDAVYLLADGLKRAGSTEAAALKQALATTDALSGVTGKITFDANRNSKKPALVIRIEDGNFTYLETIQP